MLDLLGRSTAVTHEDVFIARYHALVLTALRITDGDRAEAEDLVHEAFMRFTLVQPPLDEVQHLDAYLSRMLRNMFTSRIRRRKLAAETSLTILDYDSLDIGFHALDASGQLEVRETLHAACEYGCIRKRSSKTGSVFLLRFFHGYLPSEIASLTRLSSSIVDALVFRARREVKAYVERPDQLAFIGGRSVAGTTARVTTRSSSATAEPHHPERRFMDELRARIFNDPHQRCWTKKTLRDMYGSRSAEAIGRDELADLVGCPVCLDAVNVMLGLPRLADRFPVDTLGPGNRSGPSGPSGSAGAALAPQRRRTRAVFEHRPRQLRVSVNGFILGSHTSGGETSELTLSANVNEPITLIELLSEQDLCLAFLDTSPPPDGNARQRRHVDLSDGRYAQIEVAFDGPWPTIRASYGDPRPRHSALTEDEPAGELEPLGGQRVLEPRWRPRRLFQPRTAWVTAVLMVAIWLLFWTPGTTVSAAERIVDGIKRLVTSLLASPSSRTRDAAPPNRMARDIALPVVSTVPATPTGGVANAMSMARRTQVELRALAELQHVDAYLGQEVSFDESGARVQLRALVDTDARREALLRVLGPLLRDGGLDARVTNVNTATRPQRRTAPGSTDARTYAFTRDEFPMFATVREHLRTLSSPPPSDAELDAAARRFAMQLLDRSRRAAQHAWALKHLADRFPTQTLDAASPETRQIWHALVREHARAYQQDVASLRHDLEPVVQSQATLAEPSAIDGEASAWMLIEQLFDLHRRQDEAIQDAFAIHAAGNDTEIVDAIPLRALIEKTDRLASALADHRP